jgi:hypothetical protein
MHVFFARPFENHLCERLPCLKIINNNNNKTCQPDILRCGTVHIEQKLIVAFFLVYQLQSRLNILQYWAQKYPIRYNINYNQRSGQVIQLRLLSRGDRFSIYWLSESLQFDTINHKLLLKKMSAYSASTSSVCWMKSYLSKRKQFIKLGNVISDQLPIKNGVPQGSILATSSVFAIC